MSNVGELGEQDLFPEYGLTAMEIATFKPDQDHGNVSTSGCTPQEARAFLENLLHEPSTWHKIVSERLISHEVQAFAVIALGNVRRIHSILYANFHTLDYCEKQAPRNRKDAIVEAMLENPKAQTEALKRVIESADTV
jgi:hypothetical protein